LVPAKSRFVRNCSVWLGWAAEQITNEQFLMNTNELDLNKSKHGKHQPNYYAKNKQKFLLANQKYRAKLKAQKLPKTPSLFQQKKQKQLLKLLVNQKSFVPVPFGLKHPIIKN